MPRTRLSASPVGVRVTSFKYPITRVSDPLPDTIEGCSAEQAQLVEDRVAIRNKINAAALKGPVDPKWEASARAAMRQKKARLSALVVHKATLIAGSQATFDAAFKDSVLRMFDPEDVREIYEDIYFHNPNLQGMT